MEKEKSKEFGFADDTSSLSLTRRQFLKRMGLLGGGIAIYHALGEPSVLAQRRSRSGFFGANVPEDFNAFLRIGADGKVTALTGKIEMGQGPITSLPQMLAEELDVAYASVDIIMGDTDLCPWDAGTFGSLTTRVFGVFLREAASEAKGVLKVLAADHLKCPVNRLKTKDGKVFDKARPNHIVTYGQLTKGKIIEKHLKALPPLKSVSEFTVMGKSFLRRDSHEKVTGKAQYAGDIQLPGMVYAKIVRSPAHGAKLISVDTSAAEKIPGARVIRDGDLIAVLHKFPDEAERALNKIEAAFNIRNTGIDDKNIFDHLLKKAPRPEVASQDGDLKIGEGSVSTMVEETYLNSYVSHAPMEPHTSVVKIDGEMATVWASTQSPFRVQRNVADVLNLPVKNVRVITPFVGGGFGGKTSNRQSVEAARLAKLSGKPVQVAWTRKEEFFYDTFRPAAIVKIKSGINSKGEMVLWDYHAYFCGQRGCELFYDVPHHREAVYGSWGEEEVEVPVTRLLWVHGGPLPITPIPMPENYTSI